MPDTKISGLAAKTTPASGDLFVIVDVTDPTMDPAGTDKKATLAQVAAAVSTSLGLGTASTHAATDFAPAAVLESMVTGLVADLAGKSPLAGSTSIVTVGTIATGVWQGTPIAAAYLANTAVTPGAYTSANITVDAQGRITAAASGSGGGVTGSGTAGLLAKWTGTGAIGNATAGTDFVAPGGTTTSLTVTGNFTVTDGVGGGTMLSAGGGATRFYNAADRGNSVWNLNDAGLSLAPNAAFGFTGSAGAPYLSIDTGLARAGAGVWRLSDGSSGPGGLSSASNTPPQITANTNDYSPGVGDFQRWNSSGAFSVTGMVAGQPGEKRDIWNVGANTITLTHQDAASAAANRWFSTTAASLALAAGKCAKARYDGITQAWRVYLTS